MTAQPYKLPAGTRYKTPEERAASLAANRRPAPKPQPQEAAAAPESRPPRRLPTPSLPNRGTPARSVVTALLGAIIVYAIAGGQLAKRVVSTTAKAAP